MTGQEQERALVWYIYSEGTCLKRASSSRRGRAEREARTLGRELGVQCSVSLVEPLVSPVFEQAVPVEVEAGEFLSLGPRLPELPSLLPKAIQLSLDKDEALFFAAALNLAGGILNADAHVTRYFAQLLMDMQDEWVTAGKGPPNAAMERFQKLIHATFPELKPDR